MKIVIPVGSAEREIFQRIGRAPFFAVYDDARFMELRVNTHADSHEHEAHGGGHGSGHSGGHGGGGHHHDGPMEAYSKEEVAHHKKDLSNILDIDMVMTRAIGPNMKEAFELSGTKVLKIRKKDGETSDEVIRNYVAGTLSKAV